MIPRSFPSAIRIAAVGALMFAAPSQVLAQACYEGPRHALLIGNATYLDNENPLSEPIGSVRALQSELKRIGFQVETAENLTKEGMLRTLSAFYDKVTRDSSVIVFFSGFGAQSNRLSYVLPVNAQIWSEADVRADGVSIDSIFSELTERGAQNKIAIIDAARRNPYERRFRQVGSAGLAPANVAAGALIMYSSSPGTVVAESGGDKSLFVSELLKEIIVPGVTAEEAFMRARIGVARASKLQQVPWVSSSLTRDFVLTPTRCGPAAPSVAANAPPSGNEAAAKPGSQAAAEKVALQAIEKAVDAKPLSPNSPRASETRREPETISKGANPTASSAARDAAAAKSTSTIVLTPSTPSGVLAATTVTPSQNVAALQPDRKKASSLSTPSAETMQPASSTTRPGAATSESKTPQYNVDVAALDPALLDLDDKIKGDPQDTVALRKRGDYFVRHNDYGRAIADYARALDINPQDSDALNNQCWVHAITGQLGNAKRFCDRSLELRPRYADTFDSRGLVQLKSGKPRDALSDYSQALRLNPQSASSLYGRGVARLRLGNAAEGQADIAAAKRMAPGIAEEFAGYGIQ